jgi:hypothetical protein
VERRSSSRAREGIELVAAPIFATTVVLNFLESCLGYKDLGSSTSFFRENQVTMRWTRWELRREERFTPSPGPRR